MKEWIEYIFTYYIKIVILVLPEEILKITLKISIPVVKFFLYSRQKLMIRNFYLSFLSCYRPKDIIKIINNVWFNIGWTFFSTVKYLISRDKVLLKTKFCDRTKLKNLSHNTIIFTAHIGNWEILAQRLVIEGYKIAAIVRPLRNRLVELQVEKLREKFGGKVFYAHQMKEIMLWLKSGGIIYLLPDQHIVEGSVRVEFLGRLAFTTPIITILNKRLNSKIIPMFCIKKNNLYEIFIEDEYIPKYTGRLREDIEYNTLQINKIIEKYIKLYPDQWMWLHRRWKEK
ncbi:MAG: lysophospholipid acyltransferase family protein [Endomicrobia bacterium]|nr:lysophospholipid acyltransferase family protein [Endomicrobiia bacterium]